MSLAYDSPSTAPMEPRPRVRRRHTGKTVIAALLGLLILATGVSFLASAGTVDFGNFSTIVKPQDRPGGLPSGKRADITTLSGTFPVTQGRPSQADGVQLFRVKVAELQSNAISLHFAWLNAQDASAVLKNPNAYIKVGVYYESTAECTGKVFSVSAESGTVDVCPDTTPAATAMITPRNAAADLRPGITSQAHVWVLGTVFVPGGAPQGQQSGLTSLRFTLDARSK